MSNEQPLRDDKNKLAIRLRKEAERWSGTACRSEEQFDLRELLREAANALSSAEGVAKDNVAQLCEKYDLVTGTTYRLLKEDLGRYMMALNAPSSEGARKPRCPLLNDDGHVAQRCPYCAYDTSGDTSRCDALLADNDDPCALTEEWEELARQLERELRGVRDDLLGVIEKQNERLRSATAPRKSDPVYLVEGKPHRLCNCSPHTSECPRGVKRALSTAEFSRCLLPAEDVLIAGTVL